jgi:tRNA-splicing endonuclease subunit Sen2
MTREKTRRGTKEKATSEENTTKRRLERQQVKWERARKEREAIDQRLSEEAEADSSPGAEASLDGESSTTEVNQNFSPLPNRLGKAIGSNSSNTELLKESSTVVLNGSAKSSLAQSTKYITSPIDPLELLSLPNSAFDSGIDLQGMNGILTEPQISRGDTVLGLSAQQDLHWVYSAPVGPLELLALPNSVAPSLPIGTETFESNSHVESSTVDDEVIDPVAVDRKTNGNGSVSKGLQLNGHITREESISDPETSDETIDGSAHSDETVHANGTPNGSALINGHPITPQRKRQKSVRFSPTVEKNTFIQSEPPSPERSIPTVEEEPLAIKNQEHTQLTLEEAFFLSYALGAFTIFDPTTKSPIPNQDLFYLFRKSSYFPPRPNPSLSPDDSFMINYVVYHHFRSLGWVPRPGIKFSCDLMLYNRGPVFDHAEFGIIILPSYSDEYWSSDAFLRNYVDGKEKRTWHWMNCINRVITQVKKTLILCYVDIPRPLSGEEEGKLGVGGVLGRYRVREVVMKRFSANRMRE